MVTSSGHSTLGWKSGRTVMVAELVSCRAKLSVTERLMTCEPTSARVGVQLKVELWGCVPEKGSDGVKVAPPGMPPPTARVTISVGSGSVPLNSKEIGEPGLTSNCAAFGELLTRADGGWLVLGTRRNSASTG